MWNGFIYSLDIPLNKNNDGYVLKLIFLSPEDGITGEDTEEIRKYISYGAIKEWESVFKELKIGEITAEYANVSEFNEYREKWMEETSSKKNKDINYTKEYLETMPPQTQVENIMDGKAAETFFNMLISWNDKFYKHAILSGMKTTEIPWEHLKAKQTRPVSTMFNYRANKSAAGDAVITYYFWDIGDVVLFDMIEMEKRGIELKRCQNCGKYFVPESRSDEIYCNNIFKGNRTCRQIGYENKINGDEVLREYRKIYKTQNARKQRNKDNIQGLEERFAVWSAFAKGQLIKCQNGEISVDDMKTSISTTDWMKGGQ